nr:phage scaffolding protein [[Eubacterium] tenue]
MDWLIEILSKAEIKDNKLDIDSIIKNVNEEVPKYFIAKSDYDNVKNKLETADKTIKSFEGNMSKEDVETLKKDHKKQLENLETKYKDEMYKKDKNFALEKELTASNCRDVNDIKALLKMEDITYKDGNLSGLEGQIKSLQETKPYLFKESNENIDSKNPYYQIIGGSGVPKDENALTTQIADAIKGTI